MCNFLGLTIDKWLVIIPTFALHSNRIIQCRYFSTVVNVNETAHRMELVEFFVLHVYKRKKCEGSEIDWDITNIHEYWIVLNVVFLFDWCVLCVFLSCFDSTVRIYWIYCSSGIGEKLLNLNPPKKSNLFNSNRIMYALNDLACACCVCAHTHIIYINLHSNNGPIKIKIRMSINCIKRVHKCFSLSLCVCFSFIQHHNVRLVAKTNHFDSPCARSKLYLNDVVANHPVEIRNTRCYHCKTTTATLLKFVFGVVFAWCSDRNGKIF